MGRYDTAVRCAQIRNLVEENQYLKAMEEIEDMNFEDIPTISDLYLFADVFLKAEKMNVAKEMYYIAYKRTASRPALYRLLMLTIRMGDIEEARDLYLTYEIVAGVTLDTYELQYRLSKAAGEPRTKLIEILERLKKDEYTEEWGFQLARLYEQEGMREKCVKECEDIKRWFGTGTIVKKAEKLRENCMSPMWRKPANDEIPEPEQPDLEEPVLKKQARFAYAPAEVEEISVAAERKPEPLKVQIEVKPEAPEVKPEPPKVQMEVKPEAPEVKPEPPKIQMEVKPEAPEVKPEPPKVQMEVKPEVPEVKPEPPKVRMEVKTETEEEAGREAEEEKEREARQEQGSGFLKRLVNYFKADLDIFDEEVPELADDAIHEEDEPDVQMKHPQSQDKMEVMEPEEGVSAAVRMDAAVETAATVAHPVESLEEQLQEIEEHKEDVPQMEPEEVSVKSHPLGISALSEDIVEDVSKNGIAYNTLKGVIYKMHNEDKMVHFALTGGTAGMSLAVAKKLFKELRKINYFEARNIGKITADKLDAINLDEWAEKFIGGCMYIMEAPSLSNQSVESLSSLIEKYGRQIVIILEGSYDEMDSFLNYHKKFQEQITYKVKL